MPIAADGGLQLAPDTTRITGDALEREIAFTLEDGSITQRRHDSLRELPCAEWQARREATLRAPTPK